jgi:hypothetical protein
MSVMTVRGSGGSLDWPAYPHEALAVVLSVRAGTLSVLMWQRALPPYPRRWALPGGALAPDERLRESLQRHLADKVALRDIAYLEQLATHSATKRDPRGRVLATGYLGIVASDVEPQLPPDTEWVAVDAPPATAFDHHDFVTAGVDRLRAKLSYTNIGFALAPPTFTLSELRDVISAALGYSVHPTNLARVMTRRELIEATGEVSSSGPGGGRPAAIYRFRSRALLVTDPFAVLRPPRS